MAETTPPLPDPRDLHREGFAILHGIASFYHFIWYVHTRDPIPADALAWLCLALAIVVLWRPGDRRWLLALAAAQVADIAWWMPEVPNHWLLTGLADLTLLAAYATTRGAPDTLARLREPMAWGVAVFYLYTGGWKLTEPWFDPAVSCGAAAWNRQAFQLGLPPGGLGALLAIYGTLVLELLGPLALLWHRTRAPTAAVFATFHLVLGLDLAQGFLNFSSVMFALLWLTLEPTTLRRLAPAWGSVRMVARGWTLLFLAMVGVSAVAPQEFLVLRWLTWMGHGATVTLAFLVLALPAPLRWRPPLPIGWAFLALVTLNGASPWLGLKTRNSWQMYSNLRLEADVSNHLLLPPSLDLGGWLADDVIVHHIDVPELAEQWVGPERRVTWFMLQRGLAPYPDAALSYTRAGQTHTVPRAGADPALADHPSWLVRKLVWFRPLGPAVGDTCQW